MITIAREFTFQAAHRLPNVPEGHKCHNLHGHTWQCRLWIGGTMDHEKGWLIDYGDLLEIWNEEVHALVDHQYLNDVPGLENPTTEVIAPWIVRRIEVAFLARRGLQRLHVHALEVCEGGHNWTRWEPAR